MGDLVRDPIYEVPVVDVTPLEVPSDPTTLEWSQVNQLLETPVEPNDQNVCDLVCSFQYGQLTPTSIPENMWADSTNSEEELLGSEIDAEIEDYMTSAELTSSFVDFMNREIDKKVQRLVESQSPEIDDEESVDVLEAVPNTEDDEGETYVPGSECSDMTSWSGRGLVKVKRKNPPSTTQQKIFLNSVHHVVSKFGNPVSLKYLDVLWKRDRESLEKFMEKKKRYFKVKDSKYSLSKYGMKKLGL
jgi:hypothetical protein